uniref:Glutathione-regulated potassium-efflux system protein KefB n=1 Tax=Candidatus Methanophaga sp. ANME-1 ERB7 TaxID=2759913 RepID=A0A7G9Z302_9EURY|nr:glutathione-regulated potassium-efflux system protein KefB [Methanosarcinales archaeon ANME-1 ERB7]
MNFLLDLAIVMVSCLALGLASKYLRQASIPAYIIAGIILGKSGLNLISSDASYDFISWLGKIGVILLMFYIGLEFNYKGIKEPRRLFAGCTDFAVNFSVGFLLGLVIGLSLIEAFILASAVYISSSAIVISSLIENKRLIYPEAETVVWLMVFEDIILAILLVVLTSVMVGSLAMIPVSLAATLLLIVFILTLIRRLSNFISPLFERDDEIPILLIFALIFGFSALAYLMGILLHCHISEVIVAFFLGSALAGVKSFRKLFGTIISFKNLFLTIFFFSFGMMFQVQFAALNSADFVLALLALIFLSIVGKFVSGAIIGKRLHGSLETGLRVGAYTTPRGEFSVVLIMVVMEIGILELLPSIELLLSLVVAYVIILSIVGSFFAKHGDKIGKAMMSVANKLIHQAHM